MLLSLLLGTALLGILVFAVAGVVIEWSINNLAERFRRIY